MRKLTRRTFLGAALAVSTMLLTACTSPAPTESTAASESSTASTSSDDVIGGVATDGTTTSRPDTGATQATAEEGGNVKSRNGVRELVEMELPDNSGVDYNHVVPDPATVQDTVLTAQVTPNEKQVLYLWEEGNAPAKTSSARGGYDLADFRPTITSVPAASGASIKGALLLCAGGAFAIRGDNSDCYPTANALSARGYQCFVVDYRLQPYAQQESALDLARAIRFVRAHWQEFDLPNESCIEGLAGLAGCAPRQEAPDPQTTGNTEEEKEDTVEEETTTYTSSTKIWDVMEDPTFSGYGRLVFPVDQNIARSATLADAYRYLTWYSHVNVDKTVEICNYLKRRAAAGETVFLDIYTDEEKAADPDKENTGLFFFRGKAGTKTAIWNAGGGFMYVGAMHDSMPQCLELSKKGYNAFALIYRPGAQTACEDLARAIAYLHEHAEELQIDMSGYTLGGGSAGGRMTAWLSTYGTEGFGESVYPRPVTDIIQYTGLSEVVGDEPATYVCVGNSDGIADWRTMRRRLKAIAANGTDTQFEVFEGLPHGFGLGQGTVAEGWFDRAVAFWEKHQGD